MVTMKKTRTIVTPKPPSRPQRLRSNASYLRANYLELSEAEAFAIARTLDETADFLRKENIWKAVTIVLFILLLVFIKG